jgi:hypothetical protein
MCAKIGSNKVNEKIQTDKKIIWKKTQGWKRDKKWTGIKRNLHQTIVKKFMKLR